MHFNMCQVPARNYKEDRTKNVLPALAFIFLIQQYSVKF